MLTENVKTKSGSKSEVSTAFKWFHGSSLNGGVMLISATVASYYGVFMTDTVKIPAAAASIIMLIASLWDAINDPIMGTIADRTHTKFGRYRPYFTIFPVLMAIVGVLLFWNPTGLSTNQKIIYVAVTYIAYGMLYTILTMPHMAVLPAVTQDNDTRNQVIAMGAGFCALSFTIASTFTTQMVDFFGGSYIPLMAIYGVLGVIAFWGLFATSKERYLQPVEKRPIMHDLKKLFKHKQLYPIMLVWCLASMGYGLMFASSVYYVMYYLARPDLIALYMGIVSIGALVSMVVLMPIVLKIFKTGQKALIVTQGLTFICYGIAFFFGKNLIVLYVTSFLATAIGAMSNALVNVLVNDTIDFIQLEEGVSLNGTISAIKGFAQKCGTTVVNSGILALLAASGYIAGAIGQQPESTLITLNCIRFGIPAIICVIIVICLKYYPLEKYYPAIEEMKAKMKANEQK
ncbi:MAG: glycoside-pentoside-hexuronide (GPH):cation symporter [Clostridium sp.]|uniref:MFS transporter n=1 Tax=Clostridium sp. TaxID=1506 RepID=UPI0025C70B91|nr:glycoside-pentoside-hexuronide (GPH):cation symporter [Clostridium sp.]MBS4956945.1 glycoside-pentoside-hexuronide (GPH):cation symporter [Clostridium sp.]